MAKIVGRVRKFGNNIDTDIVAPSPALQLPMEEMKKHAFEPIYPDFYKTIKEGDVIVAGNNFDAVQVESRPPQSSRPWEFALSSASRWPGST